MGRAYAATLVAMQVRRLVLTAPHTLGWEESRLASPGPGEVRVRTRLSAVSVGSELGLVERPSADPSFPIPLGYQTLGEVEAVGEGAELVPGDRVVTTLGHASGGVHHVQSVLPVPDDVPDRVALAVILGEETHKGLRRVMLQPHERVLVAGAGLLGLLTIFNLTRRDVPGVTVLEPDPERRALAEALGASAVVPGHLSRDDFDVGVECSASPQGFTELLSHLRPGGRACVLSDGNWGALTLPPAFHTRELSVVASSDGEDYAAYAHWLWAHPDPLLARLFATTVAADELPSTFARLREYPRPVSLVAQWP